MGRHETAGRRRGIARWIVIGVVTVVVLAGIAIAYRIVVSTGDNAAQQACGSSEVLAIAAGPGAAPVMAAAAKSFDATQPVVRSTCISTVVTTVADADTLAGLTGKWPTHNGAQPALWVPDDAAYLAALDAVRPDVAAGHDSAPMAFSPVVLAVRPKDAASLASLAWSDLAEPADSGTPDPSVPRLALPDPVANRATAYAVQSVTAASTDRTAALDPAAVSAAAAVITELKARAGTSPSSTTAALTALADGTGSETAVPVVESDLVAFNAAAGPDLTAVYPTGPTAGDSILPAGLGGPSIDRTLSAAAGVFLSYLRGPAGQQALAHAGLRTAAASLDPAAGIDPARQVTVLPTGGPAVDAAIDTALGSTGRPVPTTPARTSGVSPTTTSTPTGSAVVAVESPVESPVASTVTPTIAPTVAPTVAPTAAPTVAPADPGSTRPVLTFVIDTSSAMATVVAERTINAWVQQSLTAVIISGKTDTIGLWAYGSGLGPTGYLELVPTGPLSEKIGTTPRRQNLATAIQGLHPAGTSYAYAAIIGAVNKAAANPLPGRPNRIIVITGAGDNTPNLPRSAVISALTAATGKVQLDVIGIGGSVPAESFTAIAAAGGGTYTAVGNAPDLQTALDKLLG